MCKTMSFVCNIVSRSCKIKSSETLEFLGLRAEMQCLCGFYEGIKIMQLVGVEPMLNPLFSRASGPLGK